MIERTWAQKSFSMVQILGLLHARRGQTGEQTTASPSAVEEDQVTGLQPVHSISFEINNVPEFVSTGGVDVMRLRFHNLAHFDEHRASPWWHEHSISSRRMYPSDIVSHIFIVYRLSVVDFFLREAAYFEGLKSRWYAMQWYSVKDEPLVGSAVVSGWVYAHFFSKEPAGTTTFNRSCALLPTTWGGSRRSRSLRVLDG